jgi:hypothetical protein
MAPGFTIFCRDVRGGLNAISHENARCHVQFLQNKVHRQQWMASHAYVTWFERLTPWKPEAEIISKLFLPFSLQVMVQTRIGLI